MTNLHFGPQNQTVADQNCTWVVLQALRQHLVRPLRQTRQVRPFAQEPVRWAAFVPSRGHLDVRRGSKTTSRKVRTWMHNTSSRSGSISMSRSAQACATFMMTDRVSFELCESSRVTFALIGFMTFTPLPSPLLLTKFGDRRPPLPFSDCLIVSSESLESLEEPIRLAIVNLVGTSDILVWPGAGCARALLARRRRLAQAAKRPGARGRWCSGQPGKMMRCLFHAGSSVPTSVPSSWLGCHVICC